MVNKPNIAERSLKETLDFSALCLFGDRMESTVLLCGSKMETNLNDSFRSQKDICCLLVKEKNDVGTYFT